MSSSTRFATYYAPEPAHPLWTAGCAWLGRDPSRPEWRATPHAATDTPRRYGFHATLVPPIVLRTGASPASFIAAVEALAAQWSRFEMPDLEVGVLDRFVALLPTVPVGATSPLRRLADNCLRELDPWRAPPPVQEVPALLGEWRFHMTLSDPFPDDEVGTAQRERTRDEARRYFAAALALPLTCESLCVFTEPGKGQDLVLTRRIGFPR